MNWFDWAIIAVLAISALISFKRGFIKEALSLLIWVAAFVVAWQFGPHFEGLLQGSITDPSIRFVVAFAALFVGTLLVGAVLNFALAALVQATGLTGTDRVFGMVFGVVRGLVILVVISAILKLTPAVNQPFWTGSALAPHLSLLEAWSRRTFGQQISGLQSQTSSLKR